MNLWLSGILLATALFCAAKTGSAQAPDPKSKPAPTETVVRLKVQAARAPIPVLKHPLLPELRDLNPGNPIQGYLACFSEQNNFFHSKQSVDDLDKWLEMPLKDLPVERLRGYGGVALKRADYAARLDVPDWQVLLRLKKDGPGELIVSELQQMRNLAWFLHARCRGEIADRRFEAALVTEQTMFALSRHVAEHPTAMGFLVGVAIARETTAPIEEMIVQPGCPNLFWALADLPQPFVDMRWAIQSMRMDFMNEFAQVDDNAPVPEVQLNKVVDRFQAVHDRARPKDKVPPPRDWFADKTKDEAYIASARKRLVESGSSADLVKRFSALQVVLLREKHRFVERRDEQLKGLLLPYWQVDALFAEKNDVADSPLDVWHSGRSSLAICRAQAYLDQRLAVLRCIEALRMYAAENDGKLPARLADVKLPLPVDPMSGKAFEYRLDGDVASLHPMPGRGHENDPEINKRYEVTITR